MRYYLFLLIFFLWHKTLIAQNTPTLNVTVYNESNGIGNGRVVAMLQAKNGYLWFGTTKGLLCYDSYAFRLYNDAAITNTITKLGEDSSHCIWMSFLGGGLASFNPRTGIFKNYKVQTTTDASLATSEVELIFFDSKGQLWLGITQKGLIKADINSNLFTVYDIVNQKNSFYSPAFRKVYNSVYDIYEDATGLLWLATHDGLYKFNPTSEQMTPVREIPLEKIKIRKDLFGKIVADKDTLWLSSWGAGVCAYNTKTNTWAKYLPDADTLSKLLKNVIAPIAEKNNRELWIPSYTQGLGVFNKTTHRFQFLEVKNYPNLTKELSNIITDKDGNVWCIAQAGLIKLELPIYKFLFTKVNAKAHNTDFGIYDIWEDAHYQLIATVYADGLHVFDKQTRKTSVLPVEISPNEQEQEMHVRHILKDSRRTFWIITRDFVYQYDTLQNKLIKIIQPPAYSTDKPSNSFTRAAEDKDGNIWFATKRNGVFVYNVEEKKYTHYSNNKIDSEHYINATYLSDVATDVQGRVWLGGPYGFLGYVDNRTKKIIQINKGEGMGLNLLVTQTNSLIADRKGNIWVGTYNGLYLFDCQSPTPSLLKTLRTKDGLGSNFISDLIEDALGNIWCNTGTGVSMVHPSDYHISNYGTKDGILEKENISTAKGLDSTINITTLNGYYNLDYIRLKSNEKKILLVINRMTVNDKDFYFEDKLKEGVIKLNPDQNVFSFEFAAIDFNRQGNKRYGYKLEGFDKEWIDAGDRRFVNYTNIPGGNYIFKVKTISESGVEDNTIQLPVFIATPFYKTDFFYFLIIATLSGILYWFYRYRLNNQQEVHDLQSKAQALEKEKALMMFEGLKQQLNPHFLFNSLTSLSGLIQTDQKMAGNFLEQMSKIYRYILKNRESTTVMLSEEIKFVTSYIQLQQTRFKHGLIININIDEDDEHRKISPVTLQNLIENAIKHNIVDTDSPLVIDIFCENDYLIVQNNLQKKDYVETSNRQGLVNMQSLYKYLTGKPLIVKEENNKFIIKIPLL